MSRRYTFPRAVQDGYLKKPERRKTQTRKRREYFLLLCEGTKTEPNYFLAFRKHLPKSTLVIDIEGLGKNTLSIVEEAKKKKQARAGSVNPPYDQVWVIFDRDSFESDRFDNAIHSAEAHGFHCAWSNEAFELWYILHFEFRNTGMLRSEYRKKLNHLLRTEYRKNDEHIYDLLISRQADAIRHAEKLELRNHGIRSLAKANPGTTVHLLVKELNRHLRRKVARPSIRP